MLEINIKGIIIYETCLGHIRLEQWHISEAIESRFVMSVHMGFVVISLTIYLHISI